MLKPYHAHYFTPWSEILKSQRSKLLTDVRSGKCRKTKHSKHNKNRKLKSSESHSNSISNSNATNSNVDSRPSRTSDKLPQRSTFEPL